MMSAGIRLLICRGLVPPSIGKMPIYEQVIYRMKFANVGNIRDEGFEVDPCNFLVLKVVEIFHGLGTKF